MDRREKGLLLLIIVLLVVGFFFYSSKDSLLQRPEAPLENFSNSIVKAKDVCIIMDVSNVQEPFRRNVFNCGVDFSYSLGLLGKNVVIYAFENGTCVKKDMQLPEAFCVVEVKALSCPIIYITKYSGKGSESYQNLLYVEVPENYSQSQCYVRAPSFNLPKG